MNKYKIINDQNNFLHILVCFVLLLITRSLLKHTNTNITEFLTIILLFPEDCASSGLSQDPPDKKKQFIKYGIILLGVHFNLRYSKYKIRLLESDQKCLRHGSSTKPLLSPLNRDNITKNIF